MPLAQEVVQLVARDREHIGPEARIVAKRLAAAQAAQERRLHQLVGLVGALGLEEAVQTVKVALEQLLAGGDLAAAPAVKQRAIAEVVIGHGRTLSLRSQNDAA